MEERTEAQAKASEHEDPDRDAEEKVKALEEGDVRHHDDGSVSVGGEEVDNPDDYKGDPIPGGPTDPNAPTASGERDRSGGGEADANDAHPDGEA